MSVILVTGATGFIGSVVVSDLVARGYRVRATTSKAALPDGNDAIEWRHFDLSRAVEFDSLVAGCDAVLHIAAEMGDPARMWRTNVEATGHLAEAAERAGVKAFVYTSSVAVYGSGQRRRADEDSPVLTVDEDVKHEYWGNDALRAYGRTKLGGERAIRRAAKSVHYVVMRPAVVVDVAAIVGIRDWSIVKRVVTAHRHSHHIYVRDVSDALLWAMDRALAMIGEAGSVETYNLAEDDFIEPTHAAFLQKAYAVSGDRRFRIPELPWIIDWARDFLRFRRAPLRHPLWRMRFPSERLRAAGYQMPFGMAHAYARALETLRLERDADSADATSRQAAEPHPTLTH